MRRLSLLLLLLVCALPALGAEQPFVITKDLQVVPDAANLVRVEALPIALDSMKGCYWHNFVLPFFSFPLLGVSKTNCASSNAPGVAKAAVRLDTLSSANLLNPASGSLPTVGLFERRAWAAIATRVKFQHRRKLLGATIRARLKGKTRVDCHQYLQPYPKLLESSGTEAGVGVYSMLFRALPSPNPMPYPLDSIRLFSEEMIRGWQFSRLIPVFEWSGSGVAAPVDFAIRGNVDFCAPSPKCLQSLRCLTSELYRPDYWKRYYSHCGPDLRNTWSPIPHRPDEPFLVHGADEDGLLIATLILDVGFVGNGLSSFSTSWLDFYSGDYGAYFDSLEIELEPVKKSAKS